MGWFGTTTDDPWAWLRGGGRPDPMADPNLAAGMSAGVMGGPPPYGPGMPAESAPRMSPDPMGGYTPPAPPGFMDSPMGGYTPPSPASPFGGRPPVPMAKPILGRGRPQQASNGPAGGYAPPAPPGFMDDPQQASNGPMGGHTPPAAPGWSPPGQGGGSQSMFPVKSDPNPILGNISKGWKSFTNYLGGPVSGAAGDDNSLLGYKPVSRIEAIGQTLLGAGRGVLGARGPYSNPLGFGLQGAAEGLAGARQEDLQRRQGAVQDQYRQMSGMLQMANARAALAKAQGENVAAVNPGQQLIDKVTGQPIAAGAPDTTTINGQLVNRQTGERVGAPVAPQATTLEGATVNALAPGGALPGQAAKQYFASKLYEMRKNVAAQNTINPAFQIGSAQTAYQTAKGEGAAKELLAYNDEAGQAQDTKANIAVMRQLQGVTPTGGGQEQLMQLRKLAVTAGVATPETAQKLGAQEAFGAISNQNVRALLGGKLGGNISNSDVGFATRMAANLGNEPAANNAILSIQDKLADRRLQTADLAAEWDQKNADRGGLFGKNAQGQTWRQFIQDWSEKNPLFDEDFKKQLQSGLGSGGGSDSGNPKPNAFHQLGLQ